MAGIVAAIGLGVVAATTIYGGIQNDKASKEGAKQARRQGKAQQEMHEFEAAQMDSAAGQQVALSQRNAQEELRKSALLQSHALAIAGASGAGVSDPDVNKIIGDIAAEGRLAADTHLYNGDEAAKSLKISAKLSRWQGKKAREGMSVQANAMLQQAKVQRLQSVLNLVGSAATWYAGRPATGSAPDSISGTGYTPPGGVSQQSGM